METSKPKARGLTTALYIIAGVLGSILLVWLVSLAEKELDISVAGPLSFVASLALLAVTWLYVRSTREMVELQSSERADRLLDEHYGACARIWVIGRKIDSLLLGHTGDFSNAFEPDLALEARKTRLKELQVFSKQLETLVDEMVDQAVHPRNAVGKEVWLTANILMRHSATLVAVRVMGLDEIIASETGNRRFSVPDVSLAWDAHAEKLRKRKTALSPAPRWTELTGDHELDLLRLRVDSLQKLVFTQIQTRGEEGAA